MGNGNATSAVVAHCEVDNVVSDLDSYSFDVSMDVVVINATPHFVAKRAFVFRKRTSKITDFVDYMPSPADFSVNVLMEEMDLADGNVPNVEDFSETDSCNVTSTPNVRDVDSLNSNFPAVKVNSSPLVELGNVVSISVTTAHVMLLEVPNAVNVLAAD